MSKVAKRIDPGYTPRKIGGLWRGFGWFVIPQWDIIIAAPPKCGSSSLKQFFYLNEMDSVSMITRSKVSPNMDTYFVVRNPLDRFVSLWRSKCRDKTRIVDTAVYGMSPDELIDYILSGKRDVHWTPQIELLGNVGATLVPLEMLNDWWKGNGYGDLNITNETRGDIELSDAIIKQVQNFYAEDYALYETASNSVV